MAFNIPSTQCHISYNSIICEQVTHTYIQKYLFLSLLPQNVNECLNVRFRLHYASIIAMNTLSSLSCLCSLDHIYILSYNYEQFDYFLKPISDQRKILHFVGLRKYFTAFFFNIDDYLIVTINYSIIVNKIVQLIDNYTSLSI